MEDQPARKVRLVPIWARLTLVALAAAVVGAGFLPNADANPRPETADRPKAFVAEPDPPPASPPPIVEVPEEQEARGFTGAFSSVDGLQRCKASANTVVCASTVSAQRVRLDRSGASYLGETAVGFPPARPRAIGETLQTASGIQCESSARGIECLRGGHGFVIGDESAKVLRGSSETRHESSAAAPEAEPGYIPEPGYGPEPEPEYIPEPDYESEPQYRSDDAATCDSNYDGACIPDVPYDLDCPEVAASDFNSIGYDPHGFDGDGDGVACESW